MWRHAIIVCALVACGPKPAPRGPAGLAGLLAYVPADAPIVVATVDAVPFEAIQRIRQLFGPAFDIALQKKPDAEVERLVAAIDDELGPGGFTAQRVEELGFSAQPHAVVYWLGGSVWVARLELRDRATVLATIERLARKADIPLGPSSERHGFRVYRGKKVAFAFGRDHLAAMFGPEAELDRALDRMLERPARSIADSNAIGDAVARHHLDRHLVALVDTEQMLRVYAERAGLHPTGTCARGLADAAKLAPRVVGSMAFEAHRQSGKVIVELAPQLRADVAALRVPLPAAGEVFATRRLANLAVGIDLVRGQRVLLDVVRALAPAATACGWRDLGSATTDAVVKYGQPIWPPLAAVHGVVGSLVTLAPATTGPLPERFEAFALLYGVPQELVELAARASVPADDQMHAVELAQFALHLPYRIVAQLGRSTGAIAIGDKTEALATRALAAHGTAAAPLFRLGMDYGRVMELSARAPKAKDRAMSSAMADIYGYSEMAIDVTDDGLVGTFYWELK